MKHIFVLIFAFIPLLASAQEEYDRKFYCREHEKFLSDDEFIELALSYEIAKKKENYRYDPSLPDGYEIGSVESFLESNSECCSVERDPRVLGRSWFGRWLSEEQVMVWMLIPSVKIGDRMLNLTYFMNKCGEMNEDRSFGYSVRVTQ